MRNHDSKVTVIRVRVASTWRQLMRDLVFVAILIGGLAMVFSIIAALRFGACYYLDAKALSWQQCLFPHRGDK